MNSFIAANPQFPYQSTEASEQLGLPDSPEIHLAITRVADLLLPLAEQSCLEQRLHRIIVLRVASGAVLFGWTLDAARQGLRQQLDMPLVEEQPVPAHWIHNECDWLANAAAQLRSEGLNIRPSFQRQRSNYGWVALPSQPRAAGTEA